MERVQRDSTLAVRLSLEARALSRVAPAATSASGAGATAPTLPAVLEESEAFAPVEPKAETPVTTAEAAASLGAPAGGSTEPAPMDTSEPGATAPEPVVQLPDPATSARGVSVPMSPIVQLHPSVSEQLKDLTQAMKQLQRTM